MAFPPIWKDKLAAVQKFHFPETGRCLADFGSNGIRTEVLSIGLTHFLARTGNYLRITSEGMLRACFRSKTPEKTKRTGPESRTDALGEVCCSY
jgi:hypothetical protein